MNTHSKGLGGTPPFNPKDNTWLSVGVSVLLERFTTSSDLPTLFHALFSHKFDNFLINLSLCSRFTLFISSLNLLGSWMLLSASFSSSILFVRLAHASSRYILALSVNGISSLRSCDGADLGSTCSCKQSSRNFLRSVQLSNFRLLLYSLHIVAGLPPPFDILKNTKTNGWVGGGKNTVTGGCLF